MTTPLAIGAIVATLAGLAALVRVHLLPTGYRPISNAVSDYGVGPYRSYYRAQTTAIGVAAALLAGALASAEGPGPRRVIVLLLVFAAARIVIPSFPTDLDRSRPTRTGRIHLLLAAVAFASIAWASAALPHRVDWDGTGLLVTLGWIVVATAIACGLSMTSRLHHATEPFFGLIERVFYAAMIAWLLVVSFHLL